VTEGTPHGLRSPRISWTRCWKETFPQQGSPAWELGFRNGSDRCDPTETGSKLSTEA